MIPTPEKHDARVPRGAVSHIRADRSAPGSPEPSPTVRAAPSRHSPACVPADRQSEMIFPAEYRAIETASRPRPRKHAVADARSSAAQVAADFAKSLP
jgi:hypothetical protein